MTTKSKLTFYESLELLTQAYIKDEIRPFNSEFCLCGTISPSQWWKHQGCYSDSKLNVEYPYTIKEYTAMEDALFIGMREVVNKSNLGGYIPLLQLAQPYENVSSMKEVYEEAIFNGLLKGIEVLEQIHRDRGEIIEDKPIFKKRGLKMAI